MIRIDLNPATLENIRFGYSPLLEVSLSFQLLLSPKHQAEFQPWVEATRQVLYNLDFPYLESLILPTQYVADIITPPPDARAPTIEAQLAQLGGLRPALVQEIIHDVMLYGHHSPLHEAMLVDPSGALYCVIEEVRLYWQRVIAPKWSQARAVLEQDILYHARQQALHGTTQILNALSPRTTYSNGTFLIKKEGRPPFECSHARVEDREFLLVPSIFKGSDSVSWQLHRAWNPMLIYRARGISLWERPTPMEPEKQMTQALGVSRAKVLLALREPFTTTELSHRLGMANSSVSQHLKRLRAAGLVESQRSGQYVYYQLSSRGENLVAVFQTGD